MKQFAFICFVAVFSMYSAAAQIGQTNAAHTVNRDDNREIMNQFLKGMMRDDSADEEYEGTPFLNEDFATGTLYFPNNDPLNVQIRYNVVNEEIQVKFDEGYRVVHDGIAAQIGDDLYKKYSYRGEDKSLTLLGYFRVITNNFEDKPLILLEKPYKKVKRGKAAAAMQRATPPKYLNKSDFYLKFADSNSAVLAERKTKKFVDIFPAEHREQIKKYIQDNKLKPKKEQDLVHIVNYYNSNFGA